MVWIYTGWSEHWKDPADASGMVLPSRDKGAAGAEIRQVAIGVPNQR